MYSRLSVSTILLLASSSIVLAAKIIPCAIGSGEDNGCSFCDEKKAVELGAWDDATKVENFHMKDAQAQRGSGYDVWWNIKEPDPGCRVIITQPYISDKGGINPKLSGNVVLSVGNGGCHFANVKASYSASFCCGSENCKTAGAPPTRKRDIAPNRFMSPRPDRAGRPGRPDRPSRPDQAVGVKARQFQNSNPYAEEPKPKEPSVQCSKAEAVGDVYTKAGAQSWAGHTISCNGGEACSMTPSLTVSVSTSLSNEKAFTHTESESMSVSITAGFMFVGPTATTTFGYNKDWSEAITSATSTSETDTITESLALTVGMQPGTTGTLWFSPTLRCQKYKMKCKDQEVEVEKCIPELDGSKKPSGHHGVATVA